MNLQTLDKQQQRCSQPAGSTTLFFEHSLHWEKSRENFEKKMGKYWEKYNIFFKFSHDFS